MKHRNIYDVIVVGGGHAGMEAAIISNKLKLEVVLITQDKSAIGRMSCNPSIGGLAKGQMVREMDVIGGTMGSAADTTGLQFKVLNKKRVGLFGRLALKLTKGVTKILCLIK